jgi:hypothetical protein
VATSIRIKAHPAGRRSHRKAIAGPFRGRSGEKIGQKDGCPGPGLVGRGGVATSIRIKAHPAGRRSHRKGMAGPFRGRSGGKNRPRSRMFWAWVGRARRCGDVDTHKSAPCRTPFAPKGDGRPFPGPIRGKNRPRRRMFGAWVGRARRCGDVDTHKSAPLGLDFQRLHQGEAHKRSFILCLPCLLTHKSPPDRPRTLFSLGHPVGVCLTRLTCRIRTPAACRTWVQNGNEMDICFVDREIREISEPYCGRL